MNEALAGMLLLTASAAGLFSAFVPSPFVLRTHVRDDTDRANVRAGYLPPVVLILGLSLVVGGSRRAGVFLVTLLAVGLVVAYYEWNMAEGSKVRAEA